jgi:hypothetical protein
MGPLSFEKQVIGEKIQQEYLAIIETPFHKLPLSINIFFKQMPYICNYQTA